MFDIEKFIDIDYLTEDRKSRKKKTQEVFTPYYIVKKLMDNISEEDWTDPNKTFLDPAGGNGNIILGILYRRIHEYNIPWKTALETCYGIELCEDNVAECKDRICEMLTNICEDFNEDEARLIMDSQLVCHDFFTWDFENWCPKKEEPKKPIKLQTDLFEKFKFKKPKKTKQENIDKPKKKKIIKDYSQQLEFNFL